MAETTQTTQTTQPKAPVSVTLSTSKPIEITQGNPEFILTGRIFGGGSVMVWQPKPNEEGKPIWETRVRLASADPYEKPPEFCITSNRRIGRDGEDISLHVVLFCNPWRPDKGDRRWRYPHVLRPVEDLRR